MRLLAGQSEEQFHMYGMLCDRWNHKFHVSSRWNRDATPEPLELNELATNAGHVSDMSYAYLHDVHCAVNGGRDRTVMNMQPITVKDREYSVYFLCSEYPHIDSRTGALTFFFVGSNERCTRIRHEPIRMMDAIIKQIVVPFYSEYGLN